MLKAMSRGRALLLAAGITLLFVAALNWQGILLGFAAALSEARPALLSDARWGKPGSAHKFNSRFAAGTPETDLVAWLRANDFTVQEQSRTAERLVKGLPCNEWIQVTWSAGASKSLNGATASIRDGGCL